jgi:hypothetical protein
LEHVNTKWVLSLDADYKCDQAFSECLRELDPRLAGYCADFRYAVFGKPLRATLYPPRIVLYQRDRAHYVMDGHTQRVQIEGEVGALASPILHDDWKSLSVWLGSQTRYAALEAEKILSVSASHLNWKYRLRKAILVTPGLTLIYCLIAKRLLLDGWRGIYYALQRTYAELLLSLVLLDRSFRSRSKKEQSV